jgi:DNA-binding CsgD family transcriptional regulator
LTDIRVEEHVPKSIRQKRILSLAAEDPDASMAQIADEIPTVTPDVVESVLETYGDPAENATTEGSQGDQTATSDGGSPSPESDPAAIDEATGEDDPVLAATESDRGDTRGDTSSSHGDSIPSLESLTPKQRETIVAIRDHPDATQRELAEILDVSAPTVSNRVNAIPGFEWDRRRGFVDRVLDDAESDAEAEDSTSTESTNAATSETEAEMIADGNDGHRGSDRDQTDAADSATPNETTTAADDTDPQTFHGASEGQSGSNAAATGSESESPEHVRLQPGQLEELIKRLDRLSEHLEESEGQGEDEGDADAIALADSELTHKVIHACMNSEAISKEEELEIIERIV